MVPKDWFDILAQNTESKTSLSVFFPLPSGPARDTTYGVTQCGWKKTPAINRLQIATGCERYVLVFLVFGGFFGWLVFGGLVFVFLN